MDNRTFNEIRRDIAEKINQIRDPQSNQNFNINYNSEYDILGVFVNNIALHILDLNEQLILLRSMLNPFKAVGQNLRDVMEYRGLTAKRATSTTATVTFRGNDGVIVPEGSKLQNNEGTLVFLTRQAVQIENNVASVEIYSQTTGIIYPVDLNLNPPIAGINIIGINNIVLGSNDETDQQIHMRMQNGTGALGRGMLDIIDSSLMNIDGVTSATSYLGPIYEIPADSMCSVVMGGNSKAIAQIIFEKNSFVKNTFGNTSALVTSTYLNRQYTINFMRPTQISTMVLTLTLNKISSANYPNNLKDTIIIAINGYFLMIQPGSTVYATDICAIVNSLNICKVESYELKPSSDKDSVEKIVFTWKEVPLLRLDNLTLITK
jgi:hypothetical protein